MMHFKDSNVVRWLKVKFSQQASVRYCARQIFVTVLSMPKDLGEVDVSKTS